MSITQNKFSDAFGFGIDFATKLFQQIDVPYY